ATITVDRTDDVASASACTGAASDCSLRGAVTFANANASTVINIPAGTYNITLTGATEDLNATGDLDLLAGASGVSFVGAGAATTIIQVAAGLNERIFQVTPGVNPVVGWTGSWSGLTMQNGGTPTGTAALSGGAILCGGTDNVYTISSCTFNNNILNGTVASNGGAISQSAKQTGGNGQATLTSCTFTNNRTQTGIGGGYRTLGGTTTTGTQSLTVTTSRFDNNEATTNEGGAIKFSSASASTYNVNKTQFTNNRALDVNANTGGGAIEMGGGTLTLNFNRF